MVAQGFLGPLELIAHFVVHAVKTPEDTVSGATVMVRQLSEWPGLLALSIGLLLTKQPVVHTCGFSRNGALAFMMRSTLLTS